MSETTNIKLFKHDNPSTNTNQFDVEKSLNQNWDKIDTEIGNIRENINGNDTDITDLKSRVTDLETNLDTAQNNIDEIKQEQITQNENIKDNTTAIEKNAESIKQNTTDITKLQEDNAKLKAQIPKGQASGEEINLQDSAEMELVDFGLQGNSKQATREGYNLAKYNTKITGKYNFNFEIGDITSGKTYTLYLYIPVGTLSFNLRYNTSSGNNILTDYNKTGKIVKTFTANQDGILYFNGFGESSDYNGIEQIMLLEGTYTTENIPIFEEYGKMPSLDYPSEVQAVGDSGSVEIVTSNKNVLDLGQGSANGITYNKNRITVINPTNSINITSLNLINNKNFMGKSLTLTFWANGNVETNNVEVHLSTNKETYRFQKYFTTGSFNNTKFAFTRQLQSDEYFTNMTVYVPTTALPTCNLTIDLQMEIKTATDFIEHKGNTYTLPIQKPFYKIGDYADKFTKQNNKWYEQHYIKELTITGGENWKTSGNKYTTYYVQPGIIINKNSATKKLGICNYFEFVDIVWGKDIIACDIGNMYESFFDLRFCFGSNPEFSTVDEWKAKVKALYDAEKPIKFYCVLATPELIECTEEQVQVLEQIVKDGTYKGVTHYYTNDEVKPTIEVTYYKDLETIINKQEQMQATLNNVQAQILELGG